MVQSKKWSLPVSKVLYYKTLIMFMLCLIMLIIRNIASIVAEK